MRVFSSIKCSVSPHLRETSRRWSTSITRLGQPFGELAGASTPAKFGDAVVGADLGVEHLAGTLLTRARHGPGARRAGEGRR